MQRAAEAVATFTGSEAQWWMSPAVEIGGQSLHKQPPRAELVLWQRGQELGRWLLHPLTYGSLVSRLEKNPRGDFAIPHAGGYHYDDYGLVRKLKQQGQKLLDALAPEVNALLQRMYELDDTAGVEMRLAEDWWAQAEQAIQTAQFHELRGLQVNVGHPTYLQHSSQLAEALPQAHVGLAQLQNFVANCPSPKVATGELPENGGTAGDGSRYQFRHLMSANVNSSGPFFTSKFGRMDHAGEGFGDDDTVENQGASAQQATLWEQLLEIRQRIDEVLSQLD